MSETIVYLKGGDDFKGSMPDKSLDKWKDYGKQNKQGFMYKGFRYWANKKEQVVVFTKEPWSSSEIAKRKKNGFLGIKEYILENKMSKKEKENLDEGIIMMSGLTPVMGPRLSLSMRGNKQDNFEFKGLPGQFNEDGEKIMDDQGNLLNEAAFTKKHYSAIAAVLKGSSNVKEVGEKLADIFEDDNPNFKRDFFLKAAGQ